MRMFVCVCMRIICALVSCAVIDSSEEGILVEGRAEVRLCTCMCTCMCEKEKISHFGGG